MELLRKNRISIFLILLCLSLYLLGIDWGVPSPKSNELYFYNKENVNRRLEEIKNYKENLWKGYGYYLAMHPEEEEKKLPRNLYNPIRSYHPDEYFCIKVLASMNPQNFDFNPYQFTIGGVYIYLIGLILFLFSRFKIINLTKNLGFYFLHPEEIGKFYIIGRLITTFYGIGVIILSYLIAKKIYTKSQKALLISSVISITPLLILNSSYMYVDIPGLFWIMLCLYYSLEIFEKPSYKNFFITGVLSGLALGTKIPLFTSIFIPFISLILTYKNTGKFIASAIYILGGAILSFSITNPYFFITFPSPFVELKQHTPMSFSGRFYLNALGYGIGWPIFILCMIGLFLNKKNLLEKKRILLLGWSIFYFLFISVFSKNFARYILPIVPPLIILGLDIWTWEIKKLNLLKNSILWICILYTFVYGLSYKSLFIKENIRTEAGIWIKENIPAGSSIGVTEVPWQFQMPPFDYYVYRVVVTGYNTEELKKSQPDFFILSSFQAPIPPYPMRLQKERVKFYKEFIESGLYTEEKRFEKYPSFAGITYRFKTLPEDLIYLNPTIVVYRKISYNN